MTRNKNNLKGKQSHLFTCIFINSSVFANVSQIALEITSLPQRIILRDIIIILKKEEFSILLRFSLVSY